MSRIIHTRLDDDTDALREELQKRFGWNNSQIVRDGIRALAAQLPAGGTRKRKIIGQGRYQSGIGDLASNKKHLEGFGS